MSKTRLQLICIEIMHTIYEAQRKSDDNSAYFTVDGVAEKFSGRAKDVEIFQALGQLVEANYLIYKGRLVGVDGGNTLDKYDTSTFKPLALDPVKQEKRSAPVSKPPKAKAPAKKRGRPRGSKNKPNIARIIVSENAKPESIVDEAIDKLTDRLVNLSVSDLQLKLRTLDRLSRILDPDIAEVLDGIATDLKRVMAE